MKKFVAVLLTVMLIGSVFAFADNIGPGLGRIALKGKTGKGWEILGITLNGLGGNGLFAISFGTSGYEKNTKIGKAETATFIAENMDALAADIAKGDGEYLNTLAAMLAVADPAAFKADTQANFDEIFASPDVSAEEVTEKIYALVG